MYMQDERHSSSDLNSRHQQTTEPSFLQTHRKPMKKPKRRSTDSDDPHTKPSQTESSWLQSHNKILNKQISDLERGPSCSCESKRSKSADPPPVRIPRCQCQCQSKSQPGHSRDQPCGTHTQQDKYKSESKPQPGHSRGQPCGTHPQQDKDYFQSKPQSGHSRGQPCGTHPQQDKDYFQSKPQSGHSRGQPCGTHPQQDKDKSQSKPQPGRSRGQPCGTHPQQAKCKKTDSTRTSITESEPSTTKSSFMTIVSTEIFKPCTCGSRPPYWAGQSNVVSGSSYSKAMQSGSSKNTSYQSTRSRKPQDSKPSRSKSLTNMQEDPTDNRDNQSAMTWVSKLKSDRDSVDCPSSESRPGDSDEQTGTSTKSNWQSDPDSVDDPSLKSRPGDTGKQTGNSTKSKLQSDPDSVDDPSLKSRPGDSGKQTGNSNKSNLQSDRDSVDYPPSKSRPGDSGKQTGNSTKSNLQSDRDSEDDPPLKSRPGDSGKQTGNSTKSNLQSDRDSEDDPPSKSRPGDSGKQTGNSTKSNLQSDRDSEDDPPLKSRPGDSGKQTVNSTKSNLQSDRDSVDYAPSKSRPGDSGKQTGNSTKSNMQGNPMDNRGNQSGTTWVSNLQSDPDSTDCPPLKTDPEDSDKQTETSTISVPTSRAATSRYPYNQPSFGIDDETSATTRSRSIVGKVTRLYPPPEELRKKPPGTGAFSVSNQGATFKCTCGRDFQDADGTSHGISECSSDPTSSSYQGVSGATFKCTCSKDFQDAEGTSQGVSAKIKHPPSFSQYIEADTSHYMESDSSRYATGVQKKASCACQTAQSAQSVTKFCDCHSPSSKSPTPSITTCLYRGSEPFQTSYHTHRSLKSGSCLCNVDEPNDEKFPCDTKDCECQKDLYENDQMCSCHTQRSGMKTPEDFCGSICQACATRKQRVLRLVEELSAPNSCDCNNDRASKIQRLFRELTLLLRSESEGAVAPTEEEPCSDPLPFEECCTAQHERAGSKDCQQPLSKKELQRVECFHQLEEYLRKCFLPPGEPKVPETDIYGFELNPDFLPDAAGVECSSTTKNRSSVQFYDLGDGCSGDGIDIVPPTCTCCEDGDVFHDCEGGNENDGEEICDEENGDGDSCYPCTGEISNCESDDLCYQLKTFVEKELQDIEASTKGSILEAKTPELILKELCDGSTITVPVPVKTVPCQTEEKKSETCVCPFAGMDAVSPWTDPNKDKPPYPYNLPIDVSVQKDPCVDPCVGEPRGLLPPGPLPEDVRELCERLIRKALKECGLCPSTCEECEECMECPETCPEECPETCPETCPEECPEECPCESPEEYQELCPEKCQQGCLCCHCRALICDEECKTVSKTLRSATCDPLCEMKYFIDSMIIDLHAMDCVLGTKQAKPKDIRANDASRNPNESFPVTISNVTSLGCTSLFVQWEVADCRAIAGYEIYVDGHLTNRFYSFRHHAGVVTNVDVNNPHQIVLRAQAVGQEFPGEGSGSANKDGSCCQAVAPAHPEMAAGSERLWSPSVFYYDPNAPEGEIKC